MESQNSQRMQSPFAPAQHVLHQIVSDPKQPQRLRKNAVDCLEKIALIEHQLFMQGIDGLRDQLTDSAPPKPTAVE